MTAAAVGATTRPVRGGYDLHTHSSRSDGTLPPADVVALAARMGLDGLALTDHDTLDGWDEAARACEEHGVEFVPGIELSTETAGASIHLLGYWLDAAHAGLRAECARLRGERGRRARAIVARLAALGVEVSEQRVLEIAGGAPVGRPHIALALVEAGAAGDLDDAFARWLGEGGPAHEPKRALDPSEAIALLHDAGGAVVLAHPGCSDLPEGLLDRLTEAGLDGLEADHPSHDPTEVQLWRAEARRRGLVVTGGSDFHAAVKPVKIGACATSPEALEELRSARDLPGAARLAGQRGRARSW